MARSYPGTRPLKTHNLATWWQSAICEQQSKVTYVDVKLTQNDDLLRGTPLYTTRISLKGIHTSSFKDHNKPPTPTPNHIPYTSLLMSQRDARLRNLNLNTRQLLMSQRTIYFWVAWRHLKWLNRSSSDVNWHLFSTNHGDCCPTYSIVLCSNYKGVRLEVNMHLVTGWTESGFFVLDS